VSVTFIFPIIKFAWPDFDSDLKGYLSIWGPQDTDVPGLSPSTSQLDLAVPNEPTSEMVQDKRKSCDHDALDRDINEDYPSILLDLAVPLRDSVLFSLLVAIAQQNRFTINVGRAEEMVQQKYRWLHDFLIGEWREKKFTKVRRLSECPLCTFPDKFT